MRNEPMRIFEIDDSKIKRRIKSAIDKLDDNDPEHQKILHYLKNNLFSSNIEKALKDSGISHKVRPKAFNWWASTLENLKVPLEDKIYLVKLMSDDSNLIPASVYQKNSNTKFDILSTLSPRITKNTAFQTIIGPTWDFGIAGPTGMGPGELALILFSQDAKESTGKKNGDFTVNGWTVELKSGGAVPPGDSGKKVVDKLNNDLWAQAKKQGIYDQLDLSTLTPNFDRGWLPQFFEMYAMSAGEEKAKKIFSHYLSSIYDGIPNDLINAMYENLGNPGTDRMLVPFIFNMYKESHGWDSLIFVNKGSYDALTVVEPSGFPANTKFTLVLRQEGNTYAVADGSFIVGKSTIKEPKPPKEPKAKKEPGAKKTPKKQQPLDPDLFSEPEPKVDPRAEQENQENEARGKMQEKLRDLNNPITPVYNQLQRDPMARKEIDDIIIDDILKGMSDQEIAAELNDIYVKESLQRFKRLIK